MEPFHFRDGEMCAEGVALADLAEQYGTPLYVYSRTAIEDRWRAFDAAFAGRPHLICYAVKANSNLAILDVLARLGSGFDVVSVGELERVLRAGGDPGKVVFAGVGKRADEMRRALEAGIRCFNVESEPELTRLNAVAGGMGVRAPVALRVNPDVDARTHPHISTGLRENKFGIPADAALAAYRQAARLPHIEVIGIACHIGSQLVATQPFEDALARLLELVGELRHEGVSLRHIDIGGGLGIRYRDEQPPGIGVYAEALCRQLRDLQADIVLEPGRAIVGNAGVLLTRVEYLKSTPDKQFAIVDAAMNDLIRPALYDAWQEIVAAQSIPGREAQRYDVVGPVCESADCLGRDRELAVGEGDLLVVRSAGAYGFAMSSTYNSRPRPAEVMVAGSRSHLVRRREVVDDLWAGECPIPNNAHENGA